MLLKEHLTVLARRHFLVIAAALLYTRKAKAQNIFPVLSEDAITVRVPERILLISIANAGSRLVAVGEHGVIVYSDNNGANWLQALVPVRVTLTCIGFATPKCGWAAGDYGVVLHTQDGGATWRKQIAGIEVNQLMLADAKQFMVTSPNSSVAQLALRRANIFMAAGPDKPFLCVVANTTKNAMIFGAYRMAIITVDGGENWIDISLHIDDPISHNIYNACWIGNTLYLAGEAGTVFRSEDGGKNFAMLTSPGDSTLFGVVGLGRNEVLVYGVAGAAFRSNDRGKTWVKLNLDTQTNLTCGIVLASGVVVLASEAGEVYFSHDHGSSFSRLPGNQGMGIFGMAQADNGRLVLVGSNGVGSLSRSALK